MSCSCEAPRQVCGSSQSCRGSYLTIGQPVSTLSGGEAQRIKLASELKHSGSTYIFDEPTSGLANSDIEVLVGVFDRLVDAGNTVVVITHSLELIQAADWIIDMGPEAGTSACFSLQSGRLYDCLHVVATVGAGGGNIVCAGTPEDVAACEASHTGRFLRERLA